MKSSGNVLFTIGAILFVLGACGYDGQPIICGIMVLAGLGMIYLGDKKGGRSAEKAIRVFIKSKRYEFSLECVNICEAYAAICEASESFGFELDQEELMVQLVQIKGGNLLWHNERFYGFEKIGYGENIFQQ